ncbi:hypothetical protein KAK06_02465 [Ideonella sp. 4Y11]|uniref:Uncharacterized protein n=1 Tax=Ideonella aquatica TaxID=2824119 RepID=A0A940YK96_9BURK|nr:hypothetical protein [Ideonella aquatica]MBQ0957811.1 hypothetical protein [Ideonella aquatica]
MSPPTDPRQTQLETLYRQASTAQLQRRLSDPDLLPQAREVAQAELQRRNQARQSAAVAAQAGRSRSPRNELLMVAAGAAVLLLVLWFVMPAEGFFLFLAVMLPTVLAPLGKLYPAWGKALAGVLLAAPVMLGVWLWRRGELAWQGGDYRPLGTLISWGVLLAVWALCWALGGSVLKGALHRGSWDALADELDRERSRNLEDLGRRG